MPILSRAPFLRQWTRAQAAVLAAACLLAGIAGGWLLRGFQRPALNLRAQPAGLPAPLPSPAPAVTQPDPAQLKNMADAQAAPLLVRLRSDPANPELLTELGNLYYDSRQYSVAVGYYGRALQARPADAAVRTDMGTAYWYMGDANRALAEFDMALAHVPDNPNTLFNRGLVKWRGKADLTGALADWDRLLATDPAYAQRDKVQEMIAEVKKLQALAPGATR